MDLDKVDLNAPAFGQGAQKVGDLDAAAVVEAPKVEVPKEEAIETSDEESKVPYSRFKKFHDAAKDAAQEAADWRAKYEALQTAPAPKVQEPTDVPSEWVELYGDSEASKKAWTRQQKMMDNWKDQLREEALEAVRTERLQESQAVEQNMAKLDEGFESLTDFVGRDLTEAEQSALLDIVDEYTPKDQRGNYAGEIMPFEKAWEIYGLKQQASKAPKIQARNAAANLSAAQSQGEPSNVEVEKNKSFNPLDWSAYLKRL